MRWNCLLKSEYRSHFENVPEFQRTKTHRTVDRKAGFDALGRVDDFAPKLQRACFQLLPRAVSRLSPSNKAAVVGGVAAALARRLEAELKKCAAWAYVTPFGALQLDRDVRALKHALTHALGESKDAAGHQTHAAIRDATQRLQKVANVLSVETVADAAFYVSKHLPAEDVQTLLRLKDWDDDDDGSKIDAQIDDLGAGA